ncbi:Hypothetical protein Tpal_1055 [Trichococcus palustris]|uniref:L,D-TPase catalytic domain-containing protein n=1 Tax=Trichococcus palustris TaxID=140314 RepID=A0A143YJP7_9LACT|nr:L,D-transpeptidase family protein [Trichococcus palustris]CZQ88825.1 Hypothetical protein Tpal_1055 [Trichococcus palustris]SFL00653.1 Putative peptidoglycan binding domain-containing protein [Trichococcus palustris]
MKKKPLMIGAVTAVLLLSGTYFGFGKYYEDKFLPNTVLDGIDISNDTIVQAKDKTAAAAAQSEIKIVEKGETVYTYTPADLGISIDNAEKLTEMKQEQKGWNWPLLLLQKTEEKTDLSGVAVDEAALQSIFANMPIQNDTRTAPVNAKISHGADGYAIEPEVAGNTVDQTALKEMMLEAVITAEPEVDLAEAYQKPTLLADDKKLKESLAQLKDLSDTKITYTISGKEETVPQTAIADWLAVDEKGDVTVNQAGITAYLQGLSDTYSTFTRTREFKAADGETVQVPAGTYGWTLDVASEAENLASYILAGKDVTVTPNYNGTGYSADGTDIGNTYVEVDLGSQHMWYYKDGAVALETDIVSGHPLTPTPTGVFYIWNKDEESILKGYNPKSDKTYETPVDYWMPIEWTGVGIHDSSWQSAYGGNVWQTAGSNGCINTPPEVMAQLFGLVTVGTPVVIHS